MPGIGSILGDLFKKGGEGILNGAKELIDEIVTNKEEKARLEIELRTLMNNHIKEMYALTTERMKLEIEDRDSARKMQIAALAQNDTFAKRFIYYLAAFVVFSATAFGAGLFFIEVPEQNKRLVEMFSDVFLFGGAILVLNFFFGSSKGSHDKDVIIKETLTK